MLLKRLDRIGAFAYVQAIALLVYTLIPEEDLRLPCEGRNAPQVSRRLGRLNIVHLAGRPIRIDIVVDLYGHRCPWARIEKSSYLTRHCHLVKC